MSHHVCKRGCEGGRAGEMTTRSSGKEELVDEHTAPMEGAPPSRITVQRERETVPDDNIL